MDRILRVELRIDLKRGLGVRYNGIRRRTHMANGSERSSVSFCSFHPYE